MSLAAIFQQLHGGAREQRLRWCIAYGLMLLLPWMFLCSRAGMEIAAALIGVLFLWRSAAMRDWGWLREPAVRIALVAWGWLLLTSLLTPDAAKVVGKAAPWVRFILLYAAMRYWLLPGKNAITLFGSMLMGFLLFCAGDTLWQYATGMSLTGHPVWESGRLSGPLDTPKIGILMARFLLPALLLPLMFVRTRRHALLIVAAAITAQLAILLTGERVAMGMSFTALLLIAALASWSEPRIRRHALLAAGLLLLATALLAATQPWVRDIAVRTRAQLTDVAESSYGHVATAALLVGQHHPFFGVGYDQFRHRYTDYIEFKGNSRTPPEQFIHPHNPYLEWLASAGVPGLLLFIGITAALLREAWLAARRAQGLNILVPAAMLGIWLVHFFPFMPTQSYFSNWPGIMVWFTTGAVYALSRPSIRMENN